jgi:predicted membrane protein
MHYPSSDSCGIYHVKIVGYGLCNEEKTERARTCENIMVILLLIKRFFNNIYCNIYCYGFAGGVAFYLESSD